MQNRRAVQFMPFDALSGFHEALKEVEKIKEEKKDISIEYEEIINNKLKNLKVNDTVSINYYYNQEYIDTYGKIKKIDYYNKYIIILNSKIYFNDIININLEDKY